MNKLIFTFYSVLTTILLGSVTFATQAQQLTTELTWRTGTVILTSGDTIYGKVILSIPNDLIRVTQADGTISAFSAVNVSGFWVQDNENRSGWFSGSRKEAAFNYRRQYISVPWNRGRDQSNFRTPAFFVLLQPGKYALLMRENREILYDPASTLYNSGQRTTREVIKQEFYLLAPDQNIFHLSNPKKDILRIFSKQQVQISAYAKENRLDLTDAAQLAQIVSYANSLIP